MILGDDACRRIAFVAPTGTATFNIRGDGTQHSFLHLPVNKPFEKLEMGSDRLKELEKNVGELWMLVLDERSMTGAKHLSYIDSRLKQATGKDDIAFGGISIVMVGDDGQITPIGDGL